MARRIYITVAQLEYQGTDPDFVDPFAGDRALAIATFRRLYGERTQVTVCKARKVAAQFGVNQWLWARCLFNVWGVSRMRFVKQAARSALDAELALAKTPAAIARAEARYCKAIAAGWAQTYIDMYLRAPPPVKDSVNLIYAAAIAA